MAHILLGPNQINTNGDLPKVGSQAIDFQLRQTDLSIATLTDFKGTRLVFNIFPSVDTSTCAASVRMFNKLASNLSNTKVICISRDLPQAQQRFCGAEGLENVVNLSDFATGKFGQDYGVEMIDGKMHGYHARAVVVLDENHTIIHIELCEQVGNEPNYDAVLTILG